MRVTGGGPTALIGSFIESLGDACLVVDRELKVLAANAAAEGLYARDREDLIGMSALDLCVSGHQDTLLAGVTTCDGQPRTFRIAQRRPGSTFVAEITANRCEDRLLGECLLLVRERSADADELRELRTQVLDLCVDAIVVHTLSGELVYVNQAGLGQWGFASLEEMRDAGPFGWVPPEQRERIEHRMSLIRSQSELRFDSDGTRGNGRRQHVEIHARMIDTVQGPMVVAVVRDVSDRIRAEEMVRYLAYHDTLTGLANRALLDQELSHACSAAQRHEDVVGLAFIDLDDFKTVNDTLGHAIGDHVLRATAERITSCVRTTDTVARLGGDEFVVLLPRLTCAEDLPATAQKIAEEVSRPIDAGAHEIRVTPSMGLAVFRPGESIEQFLIRADLAMYHSRQTGIAGWSDSFSHPGA